jgi:putative transposase
MPICLFGALIKFFLIFMQNSGTKWDWLHKQFILSMITKDPKQQLKRYIDFMAENESELFLDKMNLKKLPSMIGEQAFIRMI